jgi:branched-chain amino acid transport system substrate-binding protein
VPRFWKKLACACAAMTTVTGIAVVSGSVAGASSSPQAWALQYTGGKAGPATSSTPVTVGVLEPEGVAAGSFSGYGAIVQAAQSYIDKQLGGVDGHPIKLDVCLATDSQDAQTCGEQFANNPAIKFTIGGIDFFDDTSFYSALQSKGIPVITPLGITPASLTSTNSVVYGPSLPSYYPAFASYINDHGLAKKKIAVLYANNSPGLASEAIVKQAFGAAGITNVTYAAVPYSGTAPQYTSAVQAAGATSASAIVELYGDTVCVSVANALKSLGGAPSGQLLLVTNGCMDQLVFKSFGGHLPTNWRVLNFGNSPFVPGTSTGVNSYRAAAAKYAPKADWGTPASLVFANIITADKIANQVGYANITPASMYKAETAFTGVPMMVPGPQQCGFMKTTAAVCGNEVAVDWYTGGGKYTESITTVGSL